MPNTNKLIPSTIWNDHFQSKQKYLLAVSGGQDSVTLLHYLLKNLNNPTERLVIAHFDHQIRPDSQKDLEFVQTLAQKNKLTFLSQTANIPHLNQDNLEATARNYRYQFFEKVRQQLKLDYILTAHHQNDQIETILLNWNRGAGLTGLEGMSIYNPNRKLLRPLLLTPFNHIQNYTYTNKLTFRQDPTNLDTNYTRNRLRHLTIPKLTKQHPDFPITILEAADLATKLNQYYFKKLISSPLKLQKTDAGYHFSRQSFKSTSTELQLYFLYQIFKVFQFPTTTKTLQQAAKLINKHGSGQKLEQNNLIMWIDAKYINFTKPQTKEKPQSLRIQLNKIKNQLTVSWYQYQLQISRATTPSTNTIPISTEYKTITIRNFKPGDRIKPLGLDGTKKIKKVLIDQKIPKRHRSNLPIITANQEILGIPNVITSEACRISSQNHCHFTVRLVDS